MPCSIFVLQWSTRGSSSRESQRFPGRKHWVVAENKEKQPKCSFSGCPFCIHPLLLCADFVFFSELSWNLAVIFNTAGTYFTRCSHFFFLKGRILSGWKLLVYVNRVVTKQRFLAPLCSLYACLLCKLAGESNLQPIGCTWPRLLQMQPRAVSQT